MAKYMPDGYHTVTPYLTVRGAAQAMEFYKRALGAQEIERMTSPDGKYLMHGELRIGDSVIMLSDEIPGRSTCRAPQSLGGTTCLLFLYVPDVDKAFRQAVDAGCKATRPPADMFWGDRYGQVEDPFGNQWGLATHTEDLAPDEIARRARAAFAQTESGKT